MNRDPAPDAPPLRCAIYTRKSVVDGLEKDFNTLESQREMCAAYIRSQGHRNWHELANRYDDGGYSGGNLDRPAIKQLFTDIERGLVDVVVLYKIDRLTRSLADFVRLIEFFDRFGVTFVSVTQTFDTNESLGRLVLNILLTFAQFEREMMCDRIRDKLAAKKRSGRWVGGRPPIGYDLVGGKLIVNPAEADLIREIYALFIKLGSAKKVAKALAHTDYRSKLWVGSDGKRRGGRRISSALVYYMIGRKLYLGEIELKGVSYPGQHEPIVDREVFERALSVREQNAMAPRIEASQKRNLLAGMVFDEHGRSMVVDTRIRRTALYRYYVSSQPKSQRTKKIPRVRAHASGLEKMVLVGICSLLRDRFRVSGAVFDAGSYSADVERLIDDGPVAARLLERLEFSRQRQVLELLIRRIEVTRSIIRVLLCREAILALLAWDGIGLLNVRGTPQDLQRVHVLELEARAVRTDLAFSLPIEPRVKGEVYRPDRQLAALVKLARAVQAKVDEHRDLSLAEIAPMFSRRPAVLARILRINYLAPDILTAILDGRQPPGLVRQDLLYAALPMEWSQQRALLGFPPQKDVMNSPANYDASFKDEPMAGDRVQPSDKGTDLASVVARRGARRGWEYSAPDTPDAAD